METCWICSVVCSAIVSALLYIYFVPKNVQIADQHNDEALDDEGDEEVDVHQVHCVGDDRHDDAADQRAENGAFSAPDACTAEDAGADDIIERAGRTHGGACGVQSGRGQHAVDTGHAAADEIDEEQNLCGVDAVDPCGLFVDAGLEQLTAEDGARQQQVHQIGDNEEDDDGDRNDVADRACEDPGIALRQTGDARTLRAVVGDTDVQCLDGQRDEHRDHLELGHGEAVDAAEQDRDCEDGQNAEKNVLRIAHDDAAENGAACHVGRQRQVNACGDDDESQADRGKADDAGLRQKIEDIADGQKVRDQDRQHDHCNNDQKDQRGVAVFQSVDQFLPEPFFL